MKAIAGIFVLMFGAAAFPGRDLVAATKPALHAGVGAADAVAALGEADLRCLVRDANRDFLVVQTEDGKTLRDSHERVRDEARVLVPAMGAMKGREARIALLTNQLWQLGDSACELALGFDRVDQRLIDQANDLIDQISAVRAKLRPLLPIGVELFESLDMAPDDESIAFGEVTKTDFAMFPLNATRR